MTYQLVFDVPDPKLLVSANRRIHWTRRSEICRYWRTVAAAKAGNGRLPQHERAHITVIVRYPDGRRRDVGNLHGLLAKPLVDGLVDAGVLPDDDDLHLIGPDLRRDPERGPLRVVVEISPELEGGLR